VDETPPPPPPQPESWPPSDRYFVQLTLGQIHGVLHRIVLDADFWLPRAREGGISIDDLDAAYLEACRQLGTVQAALNTGASDRPLSSRGFSGAQLKAKLKGFWQAVTQYATVAKNNVGTYLGCMKSALGWSGTIVGSVATAFEEEIKQVPGAAAAAEALKEFIELLHNAAEAPASNAATPSATADSPDQGRGKRKTEVND
jgi:hypothetical protein